VRDPKCGTTGSSRGDLRKRVEMRFAHLKTHHHFERMRLRGLSGAETNSTSLRSCRTSRHWPCASYGYRQS
jgi:hypothetical protein